MRSIVVAALVGLLLFSAAPELARAQATAPIFPSTSSSARPQRVYVLPVVWIPSDNNGTATSATVTKAHTNLGIHLRTAREKYRLMLKNPMTGADRGTFELATWDAPINRARPYVGLTVAPLPLIVQSTKTYASMTDLEILGEVLTAAQCKVSSCPFVFVILVHHESDDNGVDDIYAVPFNYGFNGGGGFVRIPLDVAKNAPSLFYGSASRTLLSSVLHELGHAFGLSHLDAVYGGGPLTHTLPPGCTDTVSCPLSAYDAWCDEMPWSREKLEFHCSPSIMSYSKRNWTAGCLASDGAGGCAMPTAAQIATIPGILISENLNNLAKNSLVFPELAAGFDLLVDDDDGDGLVRWHPGYNFPDNNMIPGHPLFTTSSFHSETGTDTRMTIGTHWRWIRPLGAAYDDWSMWRSVQVPAGGWVHIDYTFPENVQVKRVRVYTGSDGGVDKATEIELRYRPDGATSTTLCDNAVLAPAAAGEVQGYSWCTPSRVHRIRLKAGSSGRVVVRMIRLYDQNGYELQPPVEPFASSTSTHPGAYWTDPNNVVGGEQVIAPYSSGFDATKMWHSKEVTTAGDWVWINVRFPEQVALTSVVVYTGHSSYYHRADRVQVWFLDDNLYYAARGDSFSTSSSTATVELPGMAARNIGIRLRTETTPATKHVVIRGIRFFTADGEVFVPRSGYSGIAPVL